MSYYTDRQRVLAEPFRYPDCAARFELAIGRKIQKEERKHHKAALPINYETNYGDTASEVLEQLRKGIQTVPEIATAVGIKNDAARKNLYRLQDQGLVNSTEKSGRFCLWYSVVEAAE